MTLKKGSLAAKRHMAKLRALKKVEPNKRIVKKKPIVRAPSFHGTYFVEDMHGKCIGIFGTRADAVQYATAKSTAMNKPLHVRKVS